MVHGGCLCGGVRYEISSELSQMSLRGLDGHMNAWQSGRYPIEQP